MRSSSVSSPVVASDAAGAAALVCGRCCTPTTACPGRRTGDAVGVQSIALSSSSSSCCCCRAPDGGKIGGRNGSEGCPKTGLVECQVRSGGGAVERERLSRCSGWCEKDGAVEELVLVLVEMAELGSGGLDVREAVPALGVLAREEEVSIKRTEGGRWRRRVRIE